MSAIERVPWSRPRRRRTAALALVVGALLAVAGTLVPSGPAQAAEKWQLSVTSPSLIFNTGTPTVAIGSSAQSISYTIANEKGATVGNGVSWMTPSGAGTVPIGSLGPGYYTLTLSAGGSRPNTLTTSFGIVNPVPASAISPSSPFGAAIHINSAGYGAAALDDAKAVGIANVRTDAWWDQIETSPGGYSYPQALTSAVNAVKARGLNPMLIANGANTMYDGGKTVSSSAGIDAFAKFAADVAQHYSLKDIEVLNEFNGGTFNTSGCLTATCYAPILKAVHEKVNAASPATNVVGPATVGVSSCSGCFAPTLISQGGLSSLDAYSIHPYHYPGGPEWLGGSGDSAATLHGELGSTPIYFSEMGWPTGGPADKASTEAQQADYLPRLYGTALANGVTRIYWYDLVDDATDTASVEAHFGLFRQPVPLTTDGQVQVTANAPKPAAITQAVTARMLAGKSFVGKDALSAPLYSAKFAASGGTPTHLLWGASAQTVNIKATGPVTVTDEYGRTATFTPPASGTNYGVGTSPVYVDGPGVVVAATTAAPSATVTFGATPDAVGATVDATPGGNDPAASTTTLADRQCWQIGPGAPNQYVYASLTPTLKHSGVNYAAVDVDYFDSAAGGRFAVVYDSAADPANSRYTVSTTGSNTWKTAHFLLTDAAFSNRQNGSDIAIATTAKGMTTSATPVCIARVTVSPTTVATDDVQVKVTSPGNVFTEGGHATFGVLAARGDHSDWSVRDFSGRTVATGTAPVDLAGHEGVIDAGALPAGSYTLTVHGTDPAGADVARSAGFAVLEKAAPASGDSMFGANMHTVADGLGYSYADAAAVGKKAGIGSIRTDASYWSNVEKPKGSYAFDKVSENVADAAHDNGQESLFILGYGNNDYGGIPSTDEANAAFGRYAAAVAGHYKDRVSALEVWNEYYGGFSSGACSQNAKCYEKTLEAAYNGVKGAAPGMKVVGGATFKVPLDWFEELFQLGGLKHLDAISIHPYRAPGAADGMDLDIAALQKLIRKYNDGKDIPIWITEQGWSSSPAQAVGVDTTAQAQDIARALIESKSVGVQKYFLYDLVNDGTDPANSENNFGLLKRPDANAGGLSTKPSYSAYATAAAELGSAGKGKAVKTQVDGTKGYVFGGSSPVTALWATDRTDKQVELHVSKPVTVVDMMGASHTLTPVNGAVYLTLTGSPVYVRASVGAVQPNKGFDLSAPAAIVAGQPIPVTATIDQKAFASELRKTVGFDIEGHRLSVGTAKALTATLGTEVEQAAATGTRTVTGTLTIGGTLAGLVEATVQATAAPVSVDVAPDIQGAGTTTTDRLAVTVRNDSPAAPVTVGAVDWTFGTAAGSVAANATIAPLTAQTFYAPVDGQAPFAIQKVAVTAHLADGSTAGDTDSFAFSPIVQATPKLKKGVLTGLDGVPTIDLATVGNYKSITAADADADMWATWDKKNLYVSAVVHEETYHKATNPNWLPAGDSIGIGLQSTKPGAGLGSWGADWYMLYAGDSNAGGAVYTESLPHDYAVGLMPGAKVQVSRNEPAKTTTYLVAIPWSGISPLTPGRRAFSLTLDVQKNDGVARDNYRQLGMKGFQQWGDGLNDWKLVNYQQVQLVPSGR